MVLIWPSYNKKSLNLLGLIKINLCVIKVPVVEETSIGRKEFRHLRAVIGARLHETHYSEPVANNTNLPNVCVLILQWLAAESSDCSSEGSEGSHHHSWPRGPRCDLPPNPTLGVFLRGRRNSPSFHLENKTKTAIHQEPWPPVFSTWNYTPVTTRWGFLDLLLSEDIDMLLAGIKRLIWYWTCHYNMCFELCFAFFMLEENTSSRS